jgi:hypothetical protein
MAAGQLPFRGQSPIDTLHAIAYEETRPVTQIRANLPPSLQRVISRCLRKKPDDRYADAQQFVDALKTVQQEIETGITSRVSLVERIRENLSSVREWSPNQWGLIALGAAGVAAFVYFVLSRWDLPLVIFFGFAAFFVYRNVQNRALKLIRRFANGAKKMPEVRMIVARDRQVTVVVDQLVARTYVRINAQIDKLNAKWFPGDRFQVSVRDELPAEELRSLLQGSGLLYVREDLMDQRI